MNVKVNYTLSAAGQKAVMIATGIAVPTMQETEMELPVDLIDSVTINSQGVASYDARYYRHVAVCLDVQPESFQQLFDLVQAARTGRDAQLAAEEAANTARLEQQRINQEAAIAADADLALAVLSKYELGEALPDNMRVDGDWGQIWQGARPLETSADVKQRVKDRSKVLAAAAAEKQAKQDAKEARRAAVIAEKGGMWWEAETMCDFKGYDLWNDNQEKRWVGVFTGVRGIDRFLNSPRGEFAFDISSLVAGDRIQGAGYDTNSRGKRRYETEFFGVVIRNDSEGLVVRMFESRALALKGVR